MTIWKNCRIDYFEQADQAKCDVKLDGDQVIVSHKEGAGYVVYKGTQLTPNHFEMSAPSVEGKATLHRMFDRSRIFEGWYKQGSEVGMYRIYLEDGTLVPENETESAQPVRTTRDLQARTSRNRLDAVPRKRKTPTKPPTAKAKPAKKK